jgi:hypothetical protein
VVDELLYDHVLVEHCHAALLAAHEQSATRGRNGAPTEVVLRMLVLRRLRRWTFEQVEWEVGGNLVYRHFCRLDANKAPDSTALIRAEQQLDGVLRELFERIVALGRKRGATRGRKLRVDTTVVEAPLRYPTDSRLCEARISHLKHRFGMARSPARGAAGMERTVLWAGIANNLAAIARSAKLAPRATGTTRRSAKTAALRGGRSVERKGHLRSEM